MHPYNRKLMSPAVVDQTILRCCKPRFHKVARVITDVAEVLKAPFAWERLAYDVPITFKPPPGLPVNIIAGRIKALVRANRLQAAGNLDRWRYSEIRLTGKQTKKRR
ncbi:MAG: hypothetical protein E7813_12570 [Bradyrhizobium sp.]|uniref:DUF3658 domain-containing protein n=1 Tax=Bradyrhizobium sp. TaxID=376 RepID=UPI0011FB785C|nr:DUF3658 domain-containing protein [Bradyrhizobium sp.]THD66989.1 MAG: hypothetical protein E7813_12570 [Bradyrhizobium sp.]